MIKVRLTKKIVREFLDYDPKRGILTWKVRARKWFENDGNHRQWNMKYAGQLAFQQKGCGGYLRGKIFHQKYEAHRIIFLWMVGRWPKPEIDHRNRIRTDNRWRNLKEATKLENARNRSSTTGVLGVTPYPGYDGKYLARFDGVYLGVFGSIAAAVKAQEASRTK